MTNEETLMQEIPTQSVEDSLDHSEGIPAGVPQGPGPMVDGAFWTRPLPGSDITKSSVVSSSRP